jgi:hypothetical protein
VTMLVLEVMLLPVVMPPLVTIGLPALASI